MSDRTNTDLDDDDDEPDIDPDADIDESLIPPEMKAELERQLDLYENELREGMEEHFAGMAEDTRDIDFPADQDIDYR